MKTTTIAPFGGPVDVCWHRGRVVTAWQSGAGTDVRLVVAEIDPVSHVILLSYSIALGDDVGAFPRLLSALGSWWLIYREGASLGGRAVLTRDGREVWRSPVECGGNDPVCFGVDVLERKAFAWQRFGDNALFVASLGSPHDALLVGTGKPTGISHMTFIGGLVLVDAARAAVPGMTRPSWAGALVCGEHPDAGVLVQAADGRQAHVWPDEHTVTPRLAHDPQTGAYAVVTSGVRGSVDYGVRLATFTDADLTTAAPPPSESWDVPGTVVDCGWFFDVQGSTVPRESEDGQCWQAHRTGDSLYIVKGSDPRMVEILHLTPSTPGDVRLAYDATDGRYPRAWRLDVIGDGRSDAKWCPTIGVVGGWRAEYPNARLIRRTENGPSTSEPFSYAVAVEAHGKHVNYGGDVGVVDAVLVTRFEPHAGQTADGYHELHHWAIVKGRAIGLVRYTEIRNGKTDREFTFNRYAPQRSVPLSSLIVHPIPDPPPTPDPEPDPMPTIPEPIITDPEAANMGARIEHHYDRYAGQAGYELRMVRTNPLSYVWGIRYYQERQRGIGHESAIQAVERAMTAAAGVAEPIPDPPPVDPVDPPMPSRLRGRLRIASGDRTFADDAGPYLPVICHAGDLLSRWTRDPGGVRALLAQIAAAGYDGVRTWTVLHGDYWRGREVGPMHQADYWSQVLGFAAAIRTAGLRWLVSQGDMLRAIRFPSERRLFMTALAQQLNAEIVLGVDAGNEALWNGETDPILMREAVEAFRAVRPCEVWSLTSPNGEERADLDAHSGSVFDVHGYRDGRSWDKIRHIFSIAYEGKPARRLGIQSEPFGFGDRVSVTANKHELTSGVMALACAVSLMSRQAWVWFSGPGVMSDEAQRMADMPGFRETPAMRAALPADLMTFQSLVHGGASQKGRRVFAVPGTDETRADHAIHDDGRFVCAVYGPTWRGVVQEKTCRIEKRIDCGEAGYVIVGSV